MTKNNKQDHSRHKLVTAYIAQAAAPARPMLRQLRRTIKSAAPQAEEKISYGIPYYGYFGRLIYFAAFKDHISLYVMGRARHKYAGQLKRYKSSAATYKITFGQPVPVALITKLVKYRVTENTAASK